MTTTRSRRRHGGVNTVRHRLRMEGEHLDALERMVVSPAAGIFSLAPSLPAILTAGTPIGHVDCGGTSVPVLSPFDGHLVAIDAVEGERLTRYQRVAWLRLAVTGTGTEGGAAAA